MEKKQNQFKVIELREMVNSKINRHMKISSFAFFIILIYLVYLVYQFITVKPIKAVMVESGSLEESGFFEAMVIRNETNVVADGDGMVDVFLHSGTTAKIGETVCSVTSDVQKRDQILEALSNEQNRLNTAIDYDKQTQKKIQSYFREYAVNLSYYNFDISNETQLEVENMLKSSSFQYSVHDAESYKRIMGNLDSFKQQMAQIGKPYKIEKSYTISFNSDGLEDIHPETFQSEDLFRTPKPINRLEYPNVNKGDFLYRKIDNLYYYFAVEVDGMAYSYLDNYRNSFVTLFFPTKNTSIAVRLEKLDPYNDKYIAFFKADRFINRFLDERFLPVQITYDQYYGLKIPNSSIQTKTVLVVPRTAIDKNVKGDYFVRKKETSDNKKESTSSPRIKIYAKDSNNEFYYILPVDDPTALAKDDIILNKVSEDGALSDYTIFKTEQIKGVYLLNKGYADFKRVEILYQSDNFSIVKKNLLGSIEIYDQIAGEGANVVEFSIVK